MLREIPRRDQVPYDNTQEDRARQFNRGSFGLKALKFIGSLALWTISEQVIGGVAAGIGRVVSKAFISTGSSKILAEAAKKAAVAKPLEGIAGAFERLIAGKAINAPTMTELMSKYITRLAPENRIAGLAVRLKTAAKEASSTYASVKDLRGLGRLLFKGRLPSGTNISRRELFVGTLAHMFGSTFATSFAWYGANRIAYPEAHANASFRHPVALTKDFAKFWAGTAFTFKVGKKLLGVTVGSAKRAGSVIAAKFPHLASEKIMKATDAMQFAIYTMTDIARRTKQHLDAYQSAIASAARQFVEPIDSSWSPIPAIRRARDTFLQDPEIVRFRRFKQSLRHKSMSEAALDFINHYRRIYNDPKKKFLFILEHNEHMRTLVQSVAELYKGTMDLRLGDDKQKYKEFVDVAFTKGLRTWYRKRAPKSVSKLVGRGKPIRFSRAEAIEIMKMAGIEEERLGTASAGAILEFLTRKQGIRIPYLYRPKFSNTIFDYGLASPNEFVRRLIKGMTDWGVTIPFTRTTLYPLKFFNVHDFVSTSPLIYYVPTGKGIPQFDNEQLLRQYIRVRKNQAGFIIGNRPYLFDLKNLDKTLSDAVNESREITRRKMVLAHFKHADLFGESKIKLRAFPSNTAIARLYSIMTGTRSYVLKPQEVIFKSLGVDAESNNTLYARMTRFIHGRILRPLQLGPYGSIPSEIEPLSIHSIFHVLSNYFSPYSLRKLFQFGMLQDLRDKLNIDATKYRGYALRAIREIRRMTTSYLNESFDVLSRRKDVTLRTVRDFVKKRSVKDMVAPKSRVLKNINAYSGDPKKAARAILEYASSRDSPMNLPLPEELIRLAENFLSRGEKSFQSIVDPGSIADKLSVAASITEVARAMKGNVLMKEFSSQLEQLGRQFGKKGVGRIFDVMGIEAGYREAWRKVGQKIRGTPDFPKTGNIDYFSLPGTAVRELFAIFSRDVHQKVLSDVYNSSTPIRRFLNLNPFGSLLTADVRDIYYFTGSRIAGTSNLDFGPLQWIPVRATGGIKEFISSKFANLEARKQLAKVSGTERSEYRFLEDVVPLYLWDRFNRVGSSFGLSLNTPQYKSATDLLLRGVFMRRVLPMTAGIMMWHGADTFFDYFPLFNNTALGEGLNVFLGNMVARFNLGTAKLRDLTGITPAAQYMEGLFPGSINSPLSKTLRNVFTPAFFASVGARTLGPQGMALGLILGLGVDAVVNMTDPTKSYEDYKAEYEGKKLVPYKKGAGWLLSKSNFVGDKIYAFGPSWYAKLRSQYKYTPVLYGNKLEAALFKPWSVLDFNPIGTLIDPYHYVKKHFYTRPYPVTSPAFSDLPIAGPLVAASVGKFITPELLLHKGELADAFREPFWPTFTELGIQNPDLSAYPGIFIPPRLVSGPYGGYSNLVSNYAGISYSGKLPAPTMPHSDLRTVFSEALYRGWGEPGGLFGWITQLRGVPGEAMARLQEAGMMTSTRRAFWESKLGNLGFLTEYLRRYFPNFSNINFTVNPIRNRFPDWLGGKDFFVDFLSSDPFTKMQNGELFLPGPGYESWQRPLNTFPAYAKYLTKPAYDITFRMLGLYRPDREEIMAERMETPIKKLILDELERRNLLVKREAEIYDPITNVEGTVDAIIRKGNKQALLEIAVLPNEDLRRAEVLEGLRHEVNFLQKQVGIPEAFIMAVSAENPRMSTVVPHYYSRKMYQEDIAKLMTARNIAIDLLHSGSIYSTWGWGYSHLDRLRILGRSAPLVYSNEFKKELRIVQMQIQAGILPKETIEEVKKITEQRNLIIQQREYYPHRFLNQITNPSSKYPLVNTNQNIKAAAEYNILERTLGAAYEAIQGIPVPLISRKFFHYWTPLQEYERNVIHNTQYGLWNHPIESFWYPMWSSLMAKREPVGGAMSGATIGWLFGGPGGAAVGTAFGVLHSTINMFTRRPYISGSILKQREIQRTFDTIEYYKNKSYFDATGYSMFAENMNRTLMGMYNNRKFTLRDLMRAAYKPDKSYILPLYYTTDPKERSMIMRELPPEIGRPLQYLWERNDRENRNIHFNQLNAYASQYESEMLSRIPGGDWSGWGIDSNVEDIEVEFMNMKGLDPHVAGLGWQQQLLRIQANKVNIRKAAAELNNRVTYHTAYHMDTMSLQHTIQRILHNSGISASVQVTQYPGPDRVVVIVE